MKHVPLAVLFGLLIAGAATGDERWTYGALAWGVFVGGALIYIGVMMGRHPQHDYDLMGGAAGWEVWRCSKCERSSIPSIFGFLWPELARYVPLARRWRCRS